MKVITIDIGASSGRVMVVSYNESKITYDEIHRFPNKTYLADDILYWDFTLLMRNIKSGIEKALEKYVDIVSIGIDTFGVDYGVIDKNGYLIGDPYCYRDKKSYLKQKEVLSLIPFFELYEKVGIQNLHFNTIYQLFDDDRLKEGSTVLLIPDLIAYYLTGEMRMELTNASTTSLYNYKKKEIDVDILNRLGIPKSVFPKMIYPKEKYGSLRKEYYPLNYKGKEIEVIATCSHDTASSVLGMNGFGNFAYLSSGTWSLIGRELSEPILTKESKEANFTNEIGIDFSIRYLKNTMGMFLINETNTDFRNRGQDISISKIKNHVYKAKDIDSYLDVNDPTFEGPGNMISKIDAYLEKTKQPIPASPGEYFRLIYKSMAFSYRYIIENLERLTDSKISTLLISGGGNQADFLNELTSNVLNKTVKTGPIESTVMGNAVAQMLHYEIFKDVNEARMTIDRSIESKIFHPKNLIDEAEYKHYLKFIHKGELKK